MYRDDDAARTERANALIDEIAALERQKVINAATDHRLETARRELSALQSHSPAASQESPGLITHLFVFGVAAAAAFVGYTLVF
jgi:hypothetical protein